MFFCLGSLGQALNCTGGVLVLAGNCEVLGWMGRALWWASFFMSCTFFLANAVADGWFFLFFPAVAELVCSSISGSAISLISLAGAASGLLSSSVGFGAFWRESSEVDHLAFAGVLGLLVDAAVEPVALINSKLEMWKVILPAARASCVTPATTMHFFLTMPLIAGGI